MFLTGNDLSNLHLNAGEIFDCDLRFGFFRWPGFFFFRLIGLDLFQHQLFINAGKQDLRLLNDAQILFQRTESQG